MPENPHQNPDSSDANAVRRRDARAADMGGTTDMGGAAANGGTTDRGTVSHMMKGLMR